jgi:glycosyltransferase involved in cell wall biosynthesis/polysaccharide pyruvyl transferase WcaK-like protein
MSRLLVIAHGYPPFHGGAENVAYYLAREAAAGGAEVVVLTSDIGGRLPPDERAGGVRIVRVRAPKREWTRHTVPELCAFLFAARRRLDALLRTWRPDCVLAHFTVPAGELARQLKRAYGIPYVVVLHGSDVPGYQPGRFGLLYALLRPAARRVWRHAARVIAVSDSLAALARQTWPAGAFEVIANGVDTETFRPAAGAAARPPARLAAVVVAQLIERKGLQVLLEALAALEPALRARLAVHVYGTGPYRPVLEARAAELGVQAAVEFRGLCAHEQLPGVLRAADLFILPSLQDALPLALLEAMASGLAVVASRVGDIPAVIADGETGLLTAPGDARGLAQAIARLIGDPALRGRLGQAARGAAERFAWARVWGCYAPLLPAAAPRGPRVLLLAGDVRWNLGDRAIRAALVARLKAALPGAEVWGLSKTPDRDWLDLGVLPFGRSALSLWRLPFGRRFDLVVWGGGQLLQDDSSKLKNPYWACVLRWVRRAARAPLVGCGVGLGPHRSAWGRRCARAALGALDALFVRDRSSADDAARLLAAHPPVRIAPDLALGLEPASVEAARDHLAFKEQAALPPGDVWVGVVIRRWFHLGERVLPYRVPVRQQGADAALSPQFLQALANLAEALDAFAAPRRVRYLIFPFSVAPWDRDDLLAEGLAAGLKTPAHVLRLEGSPRLAQALLGLCEMVVSGRMHGALLALSMRRPTVGLSYTVKVDDLFDQLGQGLRVLSLEALAQPGGAGRLLAVLADTWRERAAIARELDGRLREAAAGLAAYTGEFQARVGPEGRA